MTGEVDDVGRALVSLQLRAGHDAETTSFSAWIDTAFGGDLVLFRTMINQLGLEQSAAVQATLADGTSVLLETFHCQIEWFGVWRDVEVIANEGSMPLLGIGLLRDHTLEIDYPLRTVTLN